MPLNLSPATVANADIRSLKSLDTLFELYLDHMLAKFEQNRVAEIARNFEGFFFLSKPRFFKNHFWQSADAILEDVSVAETIV